MSYHVFCLKAVFSKHQDTMQTVLLTNEKVEVPNARVLTHKGGSQAQLAVAVHNANHLPASAAGGGMR